MSSGLAELLEALARRGLPQAEVYVKRGRSRLVDLTPRGTVSSAHREEGWAVRAGDDRRSLLAAGTGRPPSTPQEIEGAPTGWGGWPEADGEALELPGPERFRSARSSDAGASDAVPPWHPPADLEAPLVGEREGAQVLAGLAGALESELPAARLLRATLADGGSEVEVLNGWGLGADYRMRAAHLRAEAALPGGTGGAPVAATLETLAREARGFDPRSLARRLADRLVVARDGRVPERDRVAMVLAPAVAARLLEGLLPLLVGRRGFELAARLEDRHGRFAAPALTVRDDGRLEQGVLAVPADGEGVPTGELTIVESGAYRQPLLSWREAAPLSVGSRNPGGGSGGSATRQGHRLRPTGCARRASWRDLPRVGPSHLFVAPAPEVSVRSLLEGLVRGVYLLDADGAGRFDFETGRFELPVVGFAVSGGAATGPLAGARLTGGIGALLRGVERVGRDLTFSPAAGGLIGSPTLLVSGLEIGPRS